MSAPFRFLHASDLHLERPLSGITEAPDHLRPLFLEAPYQAAERLFQLAVSEKVDFVVLAGDVLDATFCGPRGPIFLCEQFRLLNDRGIVVYWAGGEVDGPQHWPAELTLPPNVRRFVSDRAEHVVHQRDGVSLCNVLGKPGNADRRIAPGDFHHGSSSLPAIAVSYGELQAGQLKKSSISYWALGGRHRATTHYPGTPQGRQPSEAGPHGCTLVEVDAAGSLHTRRLSCDVARWQTLELRLAEHTRRDQLEEVLWDQMKEAIAAQNDETLLISWNLVGQGPLWNQLRRGSLASDLLHGLRSEFGHTQPAAWSVSLTAQPPAYYADAVADQETLLGDFLRLVRQHQTQTDQPLDLAACLEQPAASVPRAIWRLDKPAVRRDVLREAAALGVQLLEGEAT